MLPIRVAPTARIEIGGRDFFLAPPVAVAVPDQASQVNIAQQSLLDDTVVGGLVDRIVVTLISYLDHSLVSSAGIDHAQAVGLCFGHHLFAEDMFARVETADRDLGMRP